MSVLANKQDRVALAEEQDRKAIEIDAKYAPIIYAFFKKMNRRIGLHYIKYNQPGNALNNLSDLSGILESLYREGSKVFSWSLRDEIYKSQNLKRPTSLSSTDIEIESLIKKKIDEMSNTQARIILNNHNSKVESVFDKMKVELSSIEDMQVIQGSTENIAAASIIKLDSLAEEHSDMIAENESENIKESSKFIEASALALAAAIVGNVVVSSESLLKEWITMRDDRVRKWHVEADSQIKQALEYFVVGGQMLMEPRDPTFATLDNIVNCRCTAVYFTR